MSNKFKSSPGTSLGCSVACNLMFMAVAIASIVIGQSNLSSDGLCQSTVNHPGFGLARWVLGAGIGGLVVHVGALPLAFLRYCSQDSVIIKGLENAYNIASIIWTIVWFGFGLSIYESVANTCASATQSLLAMAVANLVFLGLVVGSVGLLLLCGMCAVARGSTALDSVGMPAILADANAHRHPADTFLITVESKTDRSIDVSVLPNMTIAQVKLEIHDKGGPPVHKQRLVFAGSKLEDTQTVSECGITVASTLHVEEHTVQHAAQAAPHMDVVIASSNSSIV